MTFKLQRTANKYAAEVNVSTQITKSQFLIILRDLPCQGMYVILKKCVTTIFFNVKPPSVLWLSHKGLEA